MSRVLRNITSSGFIEDLASILQRTKLSAKHTQRLADALGLSKEMNKMHVRSANKQLKLHAKQWKLPKPELPRLPKPRRNRSRSAKDTLVTKTRNYIRSGSRSGCEGVCSSFRKSQKDYDECVKLCDKIGRSIRLLPLTTLVKTKRSLDKLRRKVRR